MPMIPTMTLASTTTRFLFFAFSVKQATSFSPVSKSMQPSRSLSSRNPALFLSDISQVQENERFQLPPPPEDHFVLTGDLLSLAIYGFSDHFFCNDVVQYMMCHLDSPQKLYEAAASTPTSGGILSPTADWGAPVWLDADHSYYAHVLHVTLQDRLVTSYSPLLEPVGLATCLLATCWLLAGWWHGAFQFPNTVACSTSRALTKTAETWVTCTALMLTVVGISHFVGDRSFFTRGDWDYILDSLTVVTMWRFLASRLLGTGGDDR